MSLPALDNLVRIGQLKGEARKIAEYEGFLDVEESTVTEISNLLPGLINDVQQLISAEAEV